MWRRCRNRINHHPGMDVRCLRCPPTKTGPWVLSHLSCATTEAGRCLPLRLASQFCHLLRSAMLLRPESHLDHARRLPCSGTGSQFSSLVCLLRTPVRHPCLCHLTTVKGLRLASPVWLALVLHCAMLRGVLGSMSILRQINRECPSILRLPTTSPDLSAIPSMSLASYAPIHAILVEYKDQRMWDSLLYPWAPRLMAVAYKLLHSHHEISR